MMPPKAIRLDEHIEDMSIDRNEKRYKDWAMDTPMFRSLWTQKKLREVVNNIKGKQEENAILEAKWWC